VYCCKERERKWKVNFEVLDSRLVGCATVSNGKRRISEGEYCLHLQAPAVEV
jgi:hypothetical protein